jgi:hypothetical protein
MSLDFLKTMKTIILVCFLLLALLTTNLEANEKNQKTASTLTCVLDNQSTNALGSVVLASSSESNTISVSASTSYNVTVAAVVTSVTINGQTVSSPNNGSIALANGSIITVEWQAPGIIIIVDKNTIE